jgi:hypothetical protein
MEKDQDFKKLKGSIFGCTLIKRHKKWDLVIIGFMITAFSGFPKVFGHHPHYNENSPIFEPR